MTWYAAHLILFVRLKGKRQTNFPVWENVVLIKAGSEEEAFAKAEERGREDAGDDDGSFRWGKVPAEWIFAGVRKLTLCQDNDKRPTDGTEVTFLELEVRSEDALRKLVAGDVVTVRITDRFPDEAEPASNGAIRNGKKKSRTKTGAN